MAEGKLHIGRETWTWSMPSSTWVIVRDPRRKKTLVNPCIVTEEWSSRKESPMPKHSWNQDLCMTNVTPAMVKLYIERHLAQKT